MLNKVFGEESLTVDLETTEKVTEHGTEKLENNGDSSADHLIKVFNCKVSLSDD